VVLFVQAFLTTQPQAEWTGKHFRATLAQKLETYLERGRRKGSFILTKNSH
jgi:hypothetical protein